MNLIALAVLLTGLILLIAFHPMVFVDRRLSDEVVHGWQVWPEIWQFIADPDLSDPGDLIMISAFLTSVLLIVVAPFAIPLFRASRVAWWLAAIVAGTALVGLSGVLLVDYSDVSPEAEKLGPGFFCLIASQVLNFLGLMFIRREMTSDIPSDVSP
ncbi:MAG: hypothetical protein EOP83_12465 [Verrucomicrobiaceae bacterium]|nr:MAG: hypothetical protein EOP83_12465 [Verrucomicrobiaceae bacterium]